jgi:hypothetical protein
LPLAFIHAFFSTQSSRPLKRCLREGDNELR